MKGFQLKTLLACGLCGLLLGCAASSPAPVSGLKKDYRDIQRGSYRGSYYEVNRGDTLYFIAYVTDKDVNDIISYNKLTPPYTIHPGQKLRLWRPAYTAPAYGGTGAGAVVATTSSVPTVAAATSTSVSPRNRAKILMLLKLTNRQIRSKKIQIRRLINRKQRSMLVLILNKTLTKL